MEIELYKKLDNDEFQAAMDECRFYYHLVPESGTTVCVVQYNGHMICSGHYLWPDGQFIDTDKTKEKAKEAAISDARSVFVSPVTIQ